MYIYTPYRSIHIYNGFGVFWCEAIAFYTGYIRFLIHLHLLSQVPRVTIGLKNLQPTNQPFFLVQQLQSLRAHLMITIQNQNNVTCISFVTL